MAIWSKESGNWELVTDKQEVSIANLIQCFRLGIGESPFFSNIGFDVNNNDYNGLFKDLSIDNIRNLFINQFASFEYKKEFISNEIIYSVNVFTKKGTSLKITA